MEMEEKKKNKSCDLGYVPVNSYERDELIASR